jgi:hypothetical protein
MFEQPSLSFQPSAVTRERCIGSDHAMTGYDDANGVGSIRQANSPNRFRASDLSSKITVGDGLPCRNLSQGLPNLALKWCATCLYRQVINGTEVTIEVPLKGPTDARRSEPFFERDFARTIVEA